VRKIFRRGGILIMEPGAKAVPVKAAAAQAEEGAVVAKQKNLYNRMEWAGAFGDVGTLIPFVVAYITIVKMPPLGLLFMFGITLMASGLYYRTPIPIQPMKAIGAAAIAGGISPAALYGSGLTTGLFWLLAIAITAENNELFPDRPVTEKKIAVSQGIMNLLSPLFGGIPMCHGAGGMAGHVRFGAKTGGALVILGGLLIFIALFFSDSVSIIFRIFPNAILGVILIFAGSELAIVVSDIGGKKSEFCVMLIVAAVAMWNMGVAFLVGVIMDNALRREWLRI
jgi:Molybdate transporter of MFS superfamily